MKRRKIWKTINCGWLPKELKENQRRKLIHLRLKK